MYAGVWQHTCVRLQVSGVQVRGAGIHLSGGRKVSERPPTIANPPPFSASANKTLTSYKIRTNISSFAIYFIIVSRAKVAIMRSFCRKNSKH